MANSGDGVPAAIPNFDALSNVPALLNSRAQWLVWKFEPGAKKPKKMPYYASGKRRTGKQGSIEDRQALVPFEEALNAARARAMHGVGFAFLPGDGLIGVDIDRAVDLETGEISELASSIIGVCGSYTELSPSKSGVHIILQGDCETFKSNEIGLEVFCGRQFFTVTGFHLPESPNEVTQVSVEALAKLTNTVDQAKRKQVTKGVARGPMTDERAKIESALAFLSPECGYAEWIEAGMAINSVLGDGGYAVWDYWSGKAAKYPGKTDTGAHWRSFKPGGGLTAATLYKRAIAAGWKPAKPASASPAVDNVRHAEALGGESWPDLALPGSISTPDIPANLLPGIAGQIAAAVARSTQTSQAASVMVVLAVLATAFQGRFEVSPYGDQYREPVCLWMLTALPSGARKSAIIGELSAPLYRFEKLERDRLRGEIARIESLRGVSKKRTEGLTQAAAKTDDAGERELLRKQIEVETLAMPDEIFAPRLTTSDVTPEHLQTMIATHAGRMALFSDEAGIFGILAGQYSGGKANIDVFLQSYSGTPIRVDRAGRCSHVDRPALTFGLMVQPGVLAEVAGQPRFRQSGLLARFAFAVPASTVGTRNVRDRRGVPEALRGEWEALLLSVLPRGPIAAAEVRVLELTDDARELWFKFAERIEVNQGDGGKFESIADWTSKLPGQVARIAALLELSQTRGEATHVGADCMRNAVRIGSLLIPHAQAAFRLLGADEDEAGARTLLRWITANGLHSFKRSDAQRALEGTFRKVKTLEDAAARLAEWNVLSKVRMAKNPGARSTPYYQVNPAIFDQSSVSP